MDFRIPVPRSLKDFGIPVPRSLRDFGMPLASPGVIKYLQWIVIFQQHFEDWADGGNQRPPQAKAGVQSPVSPSGFKTSYDLITEEYGLGKQAPERTVYSWKDL